MKSLRERHWIWKASAMNQRKKSHLSIGTIFLLRLAWIPIVICIISGWYFFISTHVSPIPYLMAFMVFVFYAIIIVRYLERKNEDTL